MRCIADFSHAVYSDEYGPLRIRPDARLNPDAPAAIGPHSPTAEAVGLNPIKVRVRIPRRAPAPQRTGAGAVGKPAIGGGVRPRGGPPAFGGAPLGGEGRGARPGGLPAEARRRQVYAARAK